MKRSLHLFGPLLALAVLAGCGESRQAQIERAQASFAGHDYYAARSTANAALRDDPRNRDLLLLLAQAQLRLLDAEGAEVTLERLKALGVKDAALRHMAAEASVLAGKHAIALAMLQGDTSAEAWRIRAAAKLGQGDQAAAADAFARGMAAGPDHRLRADYAWFRLSRGDVDGAAVIAAQMRKGTPDSLETLLISGEIDSRRGQYDAALASLRRASNRYPAQARSSIAEGRVLELAGRLDQAAAAVARAAAIAPDSPEVLALEVQLAAAAGKWQEVRTMLQPGEATRDPVSPDGMLYAEALLRLGYAEQSRSQLQRTVLLRPGNRNARRLLGEAQLATGDAAGAAETLAPLTSGLLAEPQDIALAEKAARAARRPEADKYRARLVSPDYRKAALLVRTADEARLRGDWAGAAAAWRLLSALGEDANVLHALAYASAKAGNAASAIEPADRALALMPENVEFMQTAGMARLLAGRDLPEARRLLGQALKANPGNLEVAELLKKAEAAAS